ncbi:riboflavin synthase subunit alpha [Salinarchaeum sp. Harcht-Bsk1]|uniref:riboflavin synthase n=1 Tax=Salinarchaeum sp. Harcht-Bsk1 TaxID=1333523 RepID=UPI0003423C6B|nr:riboflavin synthase [Salinarchaeum sp. Harcht-Bsk1]AGN02117.1 riboflavin synthase subunit alpha [Salinarchaeum sp. Harcht-Bsk1]
MFTGIVEGVGTVAERTETADGLRVRIAADWLDVPDRGASIAVSGCCLTVEDRGDGWFETFLAEETRAVTSLDDLAVGDEVNLERAMPADGRFDGHVVQGHVDETVAVRDVVAAGEDWRYTFDLPADDRYLVPKGSITLDGISLTVASIDAEAGTFDVAIIPETYEATTLSEKAVGDLVNVEYDVIAKYVESMLDGQGGDEQDDADAHPERLAGELQ